MSKKRHRFSREWIREIKQDGAFLFAVTQYLVPSLKKSVRGGNHYGLCPFHREKSASFCVSPRLCFYHCFGCGNHGTVIDLVMASEGLDFPHALEWLWGFRRYNHPPSLFYIQCREEGQLELFPEEAVYSLRPEH
jgi:DNA primase